MTSGVITVVVMVIITIGRVLMGDNQQMMHTSRHPRNGRQYG